MRTPSLFLLSVGACAGSIHALETTQTNWTVGQVVQTSSGPVSGHPASVNTDVSEYLGIPFAVPPVGNLRWQPPQLYNGTAPINGTDFGFSCPAAKQVSPSAAAFEHANITASGAAILIQLGQLGDKFSEDCLTVNIWTKPQVGEAKKAVLLWIYGGAFSIGNSDNAGYNGQYISEQEDVVLVSFNYRLNVFGFPGFPNVTQNLGLLDQRLAVEWVQKNIEAFGGDPTRITLFGQSAGSASVDYYTYAWTQDPIAHAFIQESGSVFGPAGGLGSITADEALGYWGNLSAALNCSSTDLACMQSKNYTEIIDALAIVTSGAGSAIASSFGPTVDDIVVFANYTQRSLAGQFVKLPLLLGNADYEAGLFKLLDAFNNDTLSDATWDVFNSAVFTCPAAARANVSISQNVPTWRYRWFGAFPNTQLTTIPYSGAWHASELPVLFGNYPTGNGIPNNTAAETAIGSYLRGAWATFAKNPTSGLETYEDGWPQYNPNQQSLIRLAYQNLTGNNLALGNAYDSTCSQVVSAPLGSNSTNGTVSPSGTPSSTSSSPTSSVTPASGGESLRSVSLTSLVLVLGMVMGLVGL